jgi:hypothetical protein
MSPMSSELEYKKVTKQARLVSLLISFKESVNKALALYFLVILFISLDFFFEIHLSGFIWKHNGWSGLRERAASAAFFLTRQQKKKHFLSQLGCWPLSWTPGLV